MWLYAVAFSLLMLLPALYSVFRAYEHQHDLVRALVGPLFAWALLWPALSYFMAASIWSRAEEKFHAFGEPSTSSPDSTLPT